MDEMLFIQNGNFRAQIQLDGLPSLPITRVKKLFRQIFLASWQNPETIALLDRTLPDRMEKTKEQWRMASGAYTNGWKCVANPKKRDRATRERIKNNNTLMVAVKQAKARYDCWQKIHQSYMNIKGD